LADVHISSWIPKDALQGMTKDYILKSDPFMSSNENIKQCWMIRHAQRIDETREYYKWAKTVKEYTLFDPPLTALGYKQSILRGKQLLIDINELDNTDKPTCIYVSPTKRTLGTAYNIALYTKLPIIVVPGLSVCAAAVRRGGIHYIKNESKKLSLFQKIMGNNNDNSSNNDNSTSEAKDNNTNNIIDNNKQDNNNDYELVLKNWGGYENAPFLTKKEIIKQFGGNGKVNIKFDYTPNNIEGFNTCVNRIMKESSDNTVIIVTHREGMGNIDKRYPRFGCPYVAMMRFIYHAKTKAFMYYNQ